MAETRLSRRRARGSAVGYPQVNYQIPQDCKDKLEAIANRMGLSAAEALEAVIEHLELTTDGLPRWFVAHQEALPMQRAS